VSAPVDRSDILYDLDVLRAKEPKLVVQDDALKTAPALCEQLPPHALAPFVGGKFGKYQWTTLWQCWPAHRDCHEIYSLPMVGLLGCLALQAVSPFGRPCYAVKFVELAVDGMMHLMRAPASVLPRYRRTLTVLDGRATGSALDLGYGSHRHHAELHVDVTRDATIWVGCWWILTAHK
jgi:hypothetical protein